MINMIFKKPLLSRYIIIYIMHRIIRHNITNIIAIILEIRKYMMPSHSINTTHLSYFKVISIAPYVPMARSLKDTRVKECEWLFSLLAFALAYSSIDVRILFLLVVSLLWYLPVWCQIVYLFGFRELRCRLISCSLLLLFVHSKSTIRQKWDIVWECN